MSILDSCHCVVVDQMTFFVDTDTRKEIEHWLSIEGPAPILVVDTVLGEELTIVRGSVTHLHSTTPETRAADRELGRIFDAEKPPV